MGGVDQGLGGTSPGDRHFLPLFTVSSPLIRRQPVGNIDQGRSGTRPYLAAGGIRDEVEVVPPGNSGD